MGVEPRARIGGTTLFRCSGVFDSGGKTFRQIAEDAYTAAGPGYSGARIVNNSWGAATNGAGYDATAQEYDAIVRDAVASQAGAQQMVEVVAAGNDGPGAGTLNTPGDGQERHRRRRRRERARLRDRRLRHVQRRREQRQRHRLVLEPRADVRRPDQAGPRRAGNAHQRHSAGGRPARRSTAAGSAGPTPTTMGVFFPGTAVFGEQRDLARRARRLRARGRGPLGLPPGDRPVPVGGDGQGDAARRDHAGLRQRRRRRPRRRSGLRHGAPSGRRDGRAAGSTTSPWSSRRAASRSRARST